MPQQGEEAVVGRSATLEMQQSPECRSGRGGNFRKQINRSSRADPKGFSVIGK